MFNMKFSKIKDEYQVYMYFEEVFSTIYVSV